jgi:glyoxylase-like metal-dependent hydrolase (beta-lactamase superfamily II)
MSEPETPHPPATEEFGHVVAGGPAHVYPPAGPVRVRKFSVGDWDNNVYLIGCEGQGLIVDGADDHERILSEAMGLEVVGIVQTHNHPDHTGALRQLVDALGVPVYAHRDDEMPVPANPIDDMGVLLVGGQELRAFHTPGHTPGSMCYLIGDHLFTGDTLFPGGPGATGRDPDRFAAIMAGLDRLIELPDETRVSPGHGLDTTIGRERPYVDVWRRRGW